VPANKQVWSTRSAGTSSLGIGFGDARCVLARAQKCELGEDAAVYATLELTLLGLLSWVVASAFVIARRSRHAAGGALATA
jgi:putative effector of murein hydrolase